MGKKLSELFLKKKDHFARWRMDCRCTRVEAERSIRRHSQKSRQEIIAAWNKVVSMAIVRSG